jgi:hypothetical protein
MEPISLILGILSFVLSVFTLWKTYLDKGQLRMTQPTIICFAFDGIKGPPKIFLRTLLYSTAQKGIVIETMFLKIKNGESTQVFDIWAYGVEKLVRGSGLYIGEEGAAYNHHFLIPANNTSFQFLSGDSTIEIYAIVKGRKIRLDKITVNLPGELAETLKHQTVGVNFDYSPEAQIYVPQQEKLSAEMMGKLLLSS